jgi:hypothetical protein
VIEIESIEEREREREEGREERPLTCLLVPWKKKGQEGEFADLFIFLRQ